MAQKTSFVHTQEANSLKFNTIGIYGAGELAKLAEETLRSYSAMHLQKMIPMLF